jgi:hypothetical protein
MTKQNFNCSKCGYIWKTRKEDCSPARCPRCNSLDIFNKTVRDYSNSLKQSKINREIAKKEKEKYILEQKKKGLIFYNGQWLDPVWAKQFKERDEIKKKKEEQDKIKKGYVKYKGKWVTKSYLEYVNNCINHDK